MCIKSISTCCTSYTNNMKLNTAVIFIVGALALVFFYEASTLPTTDLRTKRQEVVNSRRQKQDICVDSNDVRVSGSDYMDNVSSPDRRQKRDICNEDYSIGLLNEDNYIDGPHPQHPESSNTENSEPASPGPESGDYGDYNGNNRIICEQCCNRNKYGDCTLTCYGICGLSCC